MSALAFIDNRGEVMIHRGCEHTDKELGGDRL